MNTSHSARLARMQYPAANGNGPPVPIKNLRNQKRKRVNNGKNNIRNGNHVLFYIAKGPSAKGVELYGIVIRKNNNSPVSFPNYPKNNKFMVEFKPTITTSQRVIVPHSLISKVLRRRS